MVNILKIGKLVESLTEFIKVNIELLKLDIFEEISHGIAALFSLIIIVIVGLFMLAFGSLTLAIIINNYYESPYLGYLILTVFYVLIFVLIIILAKAQILDKAIEKQLINKSREIINKSKLEDE